ncbi:MAG: hypothetical protein WBA57_17765 [Elainellaceae cyanobacterium]
MWVRGYGDRSHDVLAAIVAIASTLAESWRSPENPPQMQEKCHSSQD